ncbi:MAG: hypothetical protein Kow0031_04990 [Anaerolineae bacterium]
MIKRLFNLVQKSPAGGHSDSADVTQADRYPHEPEPVHHPRNDATRPSHRVGKHKISDIYKAIDMGG